MSNDFNQFKGEMCFCLGSILCLCGRGGLISFRIQAIQYFITWDDLFFLKLSHALRSCLCRQVTALQLQEFITMFTSVTTWMSDYFPADNKLTTHIHDMSSKYFILYHQFNTIFQKTGLRGCTELFQVGSRHWDGNEEASPRTQTFNLTDRQRITKYIRHLRRIFFTSCILSLVLNTHSVDSL